MKNKQAHIYTRAHTHTLTGAAELVALDLSDALVGKSARAGAASAAGLNGVGAQKVGQPLHTAVAHKWVLGQVADGKPESQDRSRAQGVLVLDVRSELNPDHRGSNVVFQVV